MVEIVQINPDRKRDVKRFVYMPASLYADCPYWVPPLWSDAAAQLDRRRHPYYLESSADFFIAVKDGRDVGRIALLDNVRYNRYWNARTGFWYLFDCVDDVEVSRALFAKAEEWARAKGFNKLFGPKGFIPLDAFGVLVQGFEYLPALGGIYNYPYYDKLVTDAGFRKFTDVTSWYFQGRDMDVSERVYRVAEKARQRRGITLRTFRSKKELIDMIPAVMEAYNRSFTENWEYVPVTPEETEYIKKRLIDIIRPELFTLAMKGDEVIGFILGFPNINATIKEINGKLFPFGFIKLLRAIKRTKWLDLNGAGVLPEHRGGGATVVMYAEMARIVHENGFEWVELVQIESGNQKMQAEVRELGATLYKVHRLYEKDLV